MNARDRILSRLRAAPLGPAATVPDIDAWRAMRPLPADSAEAIISFRTNIEAAHAEVYEATADDWPLLLAKIAVDKGVRSLLFAPKTRHGAQLAAADLAVPKLVPYALRIEEWRDELFDNVDAAITGARSAIADTGSLILWPDAAEPRLMSLVPPIHFVLLDATQIHPNLDTAMLAENWAASMPTNALVISGPSKTADIQQTLAYGAHGPRELVVLLCNSGGQP